MDKPVCQGDMLDRFVEEDSLRLSTVENAPDVAEARLGLAAIRNDPNFPLHFKLQGPQDVRRVQPFEETSSDGMPMTYSWVYTWYPGDLQAVHTQQQVAEWVDSILNESEGVGPGGCQVQAGGEQDRGTRHFPLRAPRERSEPHGRDDAARWARGPGPHRDSVQQVRQRVLCGDTS